MIWVCGGHQEPERGLLTRKVEGELSRCFPSLHVGGVLSVNEDEQEYATDGFPSMCCVSFRYPSPSLNIINCLSLVPSAEPSVVSFAETI